MTVWIKADGLINADWIKEGSPVKLIPRRVVCVDDCIENRRMTMKKMLMWAPALCLVWSLQAEDAPKRSQRNEAMITVVRSQKAGDTAGSAVADRAIASVGEVVATNFTIQAGTCVRADSFLDYSTSSNVSISLLSNGQDMTATRIIPFFAVDSNSFYVAAGSIIRASDFYYIDGGSGIVPVHGRFLRIRICNDSNFDVSYAQLTARASAN